MAKAKKASGKKSINDVAHPGTTAPSDTSKPIITSRPMIKDPMVVEDKSEKHEEPLVIKIAETNIVPPKDEKADAEETTPADEAKPADESKSEKHKKKAEPAVESKVEKSEPEEPKVEESEPEETETKPEAEPEAEASDDAESDTKAEEKDEKPGKGRKSIKDGVEEEAAITAAQDAKQQKLLESKKYFLPINAVEHRRSKHVVIVGVLLAVLLALAWADIALDAGLVNVNGIKPVTHFFSS